MKLPYWGGNIRGVENFIITKIATRGATYPHIYFHRPPSYEPFIKRLVKWIDSRENEASVVQGRTQPFHDLLSTNRKLEDVIEAEEARGWIFDDFSPPYRIEQMPLYNLWLESRLAEEQIIYGFQGRVNLINFMLKGYEAREFIYFSAYDRYLNILKDKS